jgi:hypothetical protein
MTCCASERFGSPDGRPPPLPKVGRAGARIARPTSVHGPQAGSIHPGGCDVPSRVMPAGGPCVNRYERRHHNDRREDNPEFRAHVFPPWGETSWWSFRRSSKESCDPCHILVEYFINFLYDCDERFFCWVHNRRQTRQARLGASPVIVWSYQSRGDWKQIKEDVCHGFMSAAPSNPNRPR